MKEKQGHRVHTQQECTRDLFLIHCHAFLVFCPVLHRQINLPWWDQNQKRWCFSTHYQEQGPSEWLDADQRTLHSPECAPNPRRTGKPHCYMGLPNDCDRPQKVRKIIQDSNFDVRSWKIELKDRSKNCTGPPDLRMLPLDLWTQPVTYAFGPWPTHRVSVERLEVQVGVCDAHVSWIRHQRRHHLSLALHMQLLRNILEPAKMFCSKLGKSEPVLFSWQNHGVNLPAMHLNTTINTRKVGI